ncbi:hypothetical protein KI387_034624 [Taxus chinensis]|uniref:Peptidase A1 domain-containing protein n=1 Tax=Taxus chinensis TaxID=29808 RepID=A0AA38BY72_TAXCH|nr:hypothetical protein KI387_034624 [Taxus chinensis]
MRMAKLVAFLVVFPILLLLGVGVLGEKNKNKNYKVDIVNVASLRGKDGDAEGKNCSAIQLGESSFALMHARGKCSPFRLPNATWFATILEAIKGDVYRYQVLTRRRNTEKLVDEDVPLASGNAVNTGNYIIKLEFGTPGQSFYTAIDTGSDVTWIPCSPCSGCTRQAFEPSKSTTFNYLSCDSQPCQDLGISCSGNCVRTQRYGDGTGVDELLSTDTVALGSQSQPVQQFLFGCANAFIGNTNNDPGLVGFGRDATSFVSQTAELYDRTFSYCLPSRNSRDFTGSLQLGKGPLSAPGLQFTPLLSNAARPSFYYLALNGISVGEERVSIPAGTFENDESTGRGIIIDSGTVITRLVERAYNPVRDSFRLQLSGLTMVEDSSGFLDTCYKTPPSGQVTVPQITLHFDNNVDLTLPAKNTITLADDQGSAFCLAFALPPGGSSDLSVLGNHQQQNLLVVYDVAGSRLGFASQNCDG